MGNVIAAVGSALIKALLTEKVVIAIMVRLGDYLVKRSGNTLDDTVWAEVRKALGY
ncbi:MAG: hypothetical protein ACYTEQ_01830 [Planctomycetota bacterium]|jgi:hypothetical protein